MMPKRTLALLTVAAAMLAASAAVARTEAMQREFQVWHRHDALEAIALVDCEGPLSANDVADCEIVLAWNLGKLEGSRLHVGRMNHHVLPFSSIQAVGRYVEDRATAGRAASDAERGALFWKAMGRWLGSSDPTIALLLMEDLRSWHSPWKTSPPSVDVLVDLALAERRQPLAKRLSHVIQQHAHATPTPEAIAALVRLLENDERFAQAFLRQYGQHGRRIPDDSAIVQAFHRIAEGPTELAPLAREGLLRLAPREPAASPSAPPAAPGAPAPR